MKIKMIPNPEYEEVQFEATCLDEHGNKMSKMVVCMFYGRIRPPRYKKLPDGTFEEVFSHLPEGKMSNISINDGTKKL